MMALTAMTKQQLKNLDATAATAGLVTEVIMERAGMALADFLMERTSEGEAVLFLCGGGNNGGDGYAAARHLHHKGVRVSILMGEQPKTLAARNNKKLVEHLGIPVLAWEEEFSYTPYDIIVDCLLGYSQKSEPRGAIAAIAASARESKKTCYACDLPTGVDADTGDVYDVHLPATETLSFVAPKKGFDKHDACAVCGKIRIAGIGIPLFVYELIAPGGTFLVEGTAPYP